MKIFNDYLQEIGEIGFVEAVNNTVISVSGLPNAKPQEIVMLETGETGYVLGLQKDYCDIILFNRKPTRTGIRITRTNSVLSVPAGMHLLGKTIDPFGKPVDDNVTFNNANLEYKSVETRPPGINVRKRINKTFETGVAMVDLIIPLGKGQRELIIGDRKTGKTSFLLQTMLTQARLGTICIYVAIGKKQINYKLVEEYLKKEQIMDRCVIVASSVESAPGVIFLTPYTAMTLAEYFRDQGKDVLVILDDLTTHARFYRQISLLIKRFPGRNSYPADMFYAHARLLERAGNFVMQNNEEKSITCLPVAETIQSDLSGYIQTNLMSMTDGHLYFDIDLFGKGRRPPIHPFLSVTRIGRQTQNSLRQTLNREILSFMSMYEKMQNFSHFGSEVSEMVALTLQTGSKITAFFDHISTRSIPLDLQILLFSLLWVDIWRDKANEKMIEDMDRIIDLYNSEENFRLELIDMYAKSDSFNKLLGEIRGKPDSFYKKLGIN